MNSTQSESHQNSTSNLDSSYSKILHEGNTLMSYENTIMNLEIQKDDYIQKDTLVDIKSDPINNKIRIGNTFAFWYDKNGDPRIVIGPHCNFIII